MNWICFPASSDDDDMLLLLFCDRADQKSIGKALQILLCIRRRHEEKETAGCFRREEHVAEMERNILRKPDFIRKIILVGVPAFGNESEACGFFRARKET